MTSDGDRLRDMVEYLDRIAEYRPATVEQLAGDELRTSAILRWLEIVGEAAANVSAETRALHPEVRWRDIIAMRNRLIHAYPDVNLELVWVVVDRDGPHLRSQIAAILRDEHQPGHESP